MNNLPTFTVTSEWGYGADILIDAKYFNPRFNTQLHLRFKDVEPLIALLRDQLEEQNKIHDEYINCENDNVRIIAEERNFDRLFPGVYEDELAREC